MNSIFPSTKAVLANAAFFKGQWVTKFNKANTEKKMFNGATPTEVDMMTVEDKFIYGQFQSKLFNFVSIY